MLTARPTPLALDIDLGLLFLMEWGSSWTEFQVETQGDLRLPLAFLHPCLLSQKSTS